MRTLLTMIVWLLCSSVSFGHAAFSIHSTEVVFKKAHQIVKVIELAPKMPDGKTGYFIDHVYTNHHYVLVYRNYHYLGEFCHTPTVEKIDVYNEFGTHLFAITDDPQQYVGLQYLFSDHWLIILNPVEGEFHGFAFINMQHQTYTYHLVESTSRLFLHAFLHKTGFPHEKDTVWIVFRDWQNASSEWLIEVNEHGQWRKSSLHFSLPLDAPTGQWHTEPDNWKEPRIFHSLFDEYYRDHILLNHQNISIYLENKVFSPNNAYWFAVQTRPDETLFPERNTKDSARGYDRFLPDTPVYIFHERPYVLKIAPNKSDPDYRLRQVKWINQKLLYMEVWWGRILGTYYIIDVEQERIVVHEMINDGEIPFLQWQNNRK